MTRDPSFRAQRSILVVFTVWTVLVLAVPWTLAPGSAPDLSGRSGEVDNMDAIDGMNPLAAAVYIAGDVYCHQRLDRSFTENGNEIPFCARDVGIFLGLAAGMALMIAFRPRFRLLLLLALFLPILLDGGVQYIGLHESTNALRLVTGTLGGVGCSYLLAHMADRKLSTSSVVK